MSWSTSKLRVKLTPWNRFKPSNKIFLLTVPRWYFFCGSFMFFLSCVYCAFLRVCLFVPCGHLLGKGWPLGSRFVVSNCEVVTFQLVSWVRCDTWLYRFLAFAPLCSLDKIYDIFSLISIVVSEALILSLSALSFVLQTASIRGVIKKVLARYAFGEIHWIKIFFSLTFDLI